MAEGKTWAARRAAGRRKPPLTECQPTAGPPAHPWNPPPPPPPPPTLTPDSPSVVRSTVSWGLVAMMSARLRAQVGCAPGAGGAPGAVAGAPPLLPGTGWPPAAAPSWCSPPTAWGYGSTWGRARAGMSTASTTCTTAGWRGGGGGGGC